MLLTIHLIALGIWIGVVGAEFVIEFAGMKDNESLKSASLMHYKTDIWIEIPAFSIVLLTGFLMLNESHLEGLFFYKIIFAILAVFFNSINVYAVFKRRAFAIKDDLDGVQSVTRIMRLSGLVIPCFIIAFTLGMISAAH